MYVAVGVFVAFLIGLLGLVIWFELEQTVRNHDAVWLSVGLYIQGHPQ